MPIGSSLSANTVRVEAQVKVGHVRVKEAGRSIAVGVYIRTLP